MLLQLNDAEEALHKAVASGDTDLGMNVMFIVMFLIVFVLALFVLMRIKAKEDISEFMLRLQKLKSLPLQLHLQVSLKKDVDYRTIENFL